VNGGLTAGVYDDLTLTINGQRVKVPFVPVLMQAVEKLTDVEVLSQPSLVTLDNEEAPSW
jgi:Bacterial type II and III secretion system protein.